MKYSIFNAGFYLFMLNLCLFSSLNGQSNILTINQLNPKSLSTCLQADTFRLVLTNTSASQVAQQVHVSLGFPSSGIKFAGKAALDNGIVQLVDSSLSNPILLIDAILPLQTVVLSYTAFADCEVIADVKANTVMINRADVNYSILGVGIITTSLTTAQSYNVLKADMDLSMNLTNISASIGDYYGFFNAAPDGKRIISITNSGDGAMDTIRLRIKPEPEISYNGFYNSSAVAIPFFIDTNGDIILEFYGSWIHIFSNNIGPNMFLLDEEEKLTIIEDFTVVNCSTEADENTFGEVEWGCNLGVCDSGNNERTNANVHANAGAPTVVQTIANPNAVTNYCRTGDTLTFRFTNTATGGANYAADMILDVISTSNYTPRGFTLYDFTLNGILLDPLMVTALNNIQWIGFASDPGHVTPGYRIDLTGNTNAALALDLDGDGFYDDLGAGKTFKLTAKIRFDNPQPFEAQCPINYYAMFGLPQSHYKAACSDSILESLDYGKGQFYTASLFPNSLANLITAPTDMIEDQAEEFTFCTGSWSNPLSMDFFDCPLDSHYVTVNIPDGYYPVGNAVLFSSIAGDSHLLTSIFDGSILTISGGAQSFIAGQERTWNGCYKLPLAFSCDSTDSGSIGNESTLSWTLNYLCDTCSIVQRRVCSETILYNHASCSQGNLTCEGVVTSGFDVNRTTFGWTDYSLNTRVQATDPGINLDAAYTYDTIQTITTGFVKADNYDQLYAEVKYEAPSELIKWTNGIVQVFDVSGNVFTTCPIVNPPTLTVSGSKYNYVFTLPLSCIGAIDSGFQLRLVNSWEVLNSTTIKGFKVFDIPLFRSNYHFTRNDSLFKCDEWGAKFSLYNYGSFPFIYADKVNKCDPFKVVMFVKNYGGSSGDDFPNEIRHLFRLNRKIVVHIPDGYTYVPLSAYTYQVLDATNPLQPLTTLIQLTPVFQDADSVVFEYDWPVLDKYEQSGSVDIYPPLFQYQLQPTCERQNTTQAYLDYTYTNYDYATYVPYHEEAVSVDRNFTINNPVPRITVNTGAYIVDAYTNKVKWQVQVCNQVGAGQSVVGDAQNLWIDADNLVSNTGNIQIDSVYVSANNVQSVINYPEGDAVNSLLQLGNLTANTCRTYTLEGSYVNCGEVTDSLRIRTGWSCEGYPEPEEADEASCYVSENVLAIRYKTADMNMEVTAPLGSFEVCDTLSYLIELQSTGVAMMYDVDFWANVPNGASIINPEYLYTLASASWKALPNATNSFSGTNPKGWHLSQILTEWSAYNGGFYGSQRPDSAKIQLRFDVALSCDYNPNDSLVFNAFGITNCQDTLEFKQVKRILINGFSALDKLSVSMTLPDTLQCNETGIIDINVSNLNTTSNQFEDSLKVEIPAVFGVLNAIPFGANVQNNGTTTTVKWAIPPGNIGGGANTVYSIFVVGNVVPQCTSIDISGTIYYVGSSNCGAVQCSPTAIIDNTIKSTVLCCNPCNVTAFFEADTVCIGDTTCFTLSDQTTIGTDYAHSWQFGDGNSAIEEQACHIYSQAGTYVVCHTVTQFSTGCYTSFCDTVVVNAYAKASIELLGCNPFCEGDTVHLTVTAAPVGGQGNYERIEWVELGNPNVVIGTSDTLAVSASGTYNAIVYNGKCAGDCLAITLSQQQAPEISIPDTAFCAGDSILICAGVSPSVDGTSYEWQLNGKVFNSEDSCIYISSPGQYIVTVGEKLPFGCCTCKGVDTFNVLINTISVTVPDLTICEGENGTLCATASGGYAPYTFEWQPNGEITPCIEVNTSGEYIVTVTDDMACTAVDTGLLTLDLPPNAAFNYDDTVCVQVETCFVPINSGTHYWEVSDSTGAVVTTSSANEFCYLFPNAGTFSVTHILTTNCGVDTLRHSIVIAPPVEACIVLLGSNPFCEGDTVCLTVNDPFNQVTQVEWYLNDVLVFVGDILCVTEPGTYRAVVSDNNGCTSECMCIVLTQIPAPVLNLPDHLTICGGQNNTLLDAGSGHSNYVWFKDNQFLAYGVSSITVSSAGMYRVEVTGANGCKAIDSTLVSIASEAIIIGSTLQTVCRNQPVTVFTVCNPDYTYQWSISANGTDTGTPISASDTCRLSLMGNQLLNGNNWFHLLVSDKTTGCSFRARIRIIHRINNCNEISLEPNPVLGNSVSMNYDLMDAGVQEAKIEFRNIMGDVVATYMADTTRQEAILDVTDLANGVYFVNLLADGVLIDTQKLVIAR